MTLIQMSASGAVLIVVIAGIRALLINRLPKKTFLALWAVVLLRLVVPVSVSSSLSIYGLLPGNGEWQQELTAFWALRAQEQGKETGREEERSGETGREEREQALFPEGEASDWEAYGQPGITAGFDMAGSEFFGENINGKNLQNMSESAEPQSSLLSRLMEDVSEISLWSLLWAAGAGSLAVYFMVSYIRCCREFRMALPVEEDAARQWPSRHPGAGGLCRTVTLRQFQGISAPLTYGILRPVILLPKGMDWSDAQRVSYVLEHELVHIRRLDALTKLVLTGTLCIHWFNPLVWLFYLLANRDLELSCDEAVIRRFGSEARAPYARALISMEEARSRLLPLYNGFSRNAIEERITAIMKLHKPSLAALAGAVVLVFCVSGVFATSARQDSLREALTALPGDDFTREESQKLFALWIEDYEKMTVSAYQEQMWKMVDTREYVELMDRFSLWEQTYELPEGREAEALSAFNQYYFSVFEPLTASRWQSRDFSGSIQRFGPGSYDIATLEYVIWLNVQDRDGLLVGDYEAAVPAIRQELQSFMEGKTWEELLDGRAILEELKTEKQRLDQKFSKKELTVSLECTFVPTGDAYDPWELDAFVREQISAQTQDTIARTLDPYLAFGLTWEYEENENGGRFRMYYEGKEVRSIWDEEEQIWIADHLGTGDYAADALELTAVYEDGKLTGLRPSGSVEQGAKTGREEREQALSLEEEHGKRMSSPGSQAEYDSLLALKTKDYKNLSLADFNQAILNWCNENPDGMECIVEDAFREEYGVVLTTGEKAFVSLSFPLSREENYQRITSQQTKEPKKPACVGGRKYFRQEEATGAWCSLYYQFSYEVKEPEKATVGERDGCVGGMLEDIRKFWEDTSLLELLDMSEEQVTEYFQTLAGKHSTKQIVLSIDNDEIQFEHRRGSNLVSWDRAEILSYRDGGGFYVHTAFTSLAEKTITGMEYAMTAYDAAGNPKKLNWNFMDSSSESAYECVVKREGLQVQYGESLEEPGGWSLPEQVEYVLIGLKRITFADSTVWENPVYGDWLARYRGEAVPVEELRNYYPQQIFI